MSSIFLIINTIGAILTQQTRQIGVMMAIGANARQIAGMYYVLAIAFGLLALLVAVPLSYVGGRAFTGFLASQLNVDIVDFRLPPQVLAIEFVAALVVPLLAATLPIRGVMRRPLEIGSQSCGQHQRRLQRVREAVDDLGVGRHCFLLLGNRDRFLHLR